MKKSLLALILLTCMILSVSCGKPAETTGAETTAEVPGTETTPAETTAEETPPVTTEPVTTTETTEPPLPASQILYRVDLDGIGDKESVILDTAAIDKAGAKAIVIKNSLGETLYEYEYASQSQPGGWTLGTEQSGRSWLLQWQAYEEPVEGDATRRLLVISINQFDLNEKGEIRRIKNSTNTFDTGKRALYDRYNDDILAAENKLAELFDHSVLLVDNSTGTLRVAQKDAPAVASYHYVYTPFEPISRTPAAQLLKLCNERMGAVKNLRVTSTYQVTLSSPFDKTLSCTLSSRVGGIGGGDFTFLSTTEGLGALDSTSVVIGSSYFISVISGEKVEYLLTSEQMAEFTEAFMPAPSYFGVDDFETVTVTEVGGSYRITFTGYTQAAYTEMLSYFNLGQASGATDPKDYTACDWLDATTLYGLPAPTSTSYYILADKDGFVTEEALSMTYSIKIGDENTTVTYTAVEKSEDLGDSAGITVPADAADYTLSLMPDAYGEYPGMLITDVVLTADEGTGALFLFASSANTLSARVYDKAIHDFLPDTYSVTLDGTHCGGIYYTNMDGLPGLFIYNIDRLSTTAVTSELSYRYIGFGKDAATGQLSAETKATKTIRLDEKTAWSSNRIKIDSFLSTIQPYLSAGTLLIDSSSGSFLTLDYNNPITLTSVDPFWIYTDIENDIPFGYTPVGKVVFVVDADSLNVRSTPVVPEPGEPDNRIGWLTRGESAYCIAYTPDGWCLIDFEDTKGYVSSKYIILCPEGYTPCYETVELIEDATSLYVRSAPYIPEEGQEDNSIGFINKNSSVVRIATGEDGWSLVLVEGEIGFASGKYLKVVR